MRSPALMSAIFLLALNVHAEPAADAGAEPPTKLNVEVAAGTKYYPQELANTGAHGTVVLKVQLGDDSQPVESSLAETSGSTELDELASTYLQQLKFSPVEGKLLAKNVLLSVEFVKDSITNIRDKTCADFNADLAFERKRSPEARVNDMRAYSVAMDLQPVADTPNDKQQRELTRNLKRLPAKVEKECAANPDKKFFDVFVNGSKKK